MKILVLSVAALSFPLAAVAQNCPNTWLTGDPQAGTDGIVRASVEWDPDGAGPAQPVIVLGGEFTVAGSAIAANLVTWDPVAGSWSALGGGVDGTVQALAVAANGDLIVGGRFTMAGTVAAANIASWNGSSWSALAGGVSATGYVNDLEVAANGDVFVGGVFGDAGGVAVLNIARWDGANWSALGGGANGEVWTLSELANGDLFVGGRFVAAGGVFVNRAARWDGTNWSSVGGGFVSSFPISVFDSAELPNGDIVVTGPLISLPGSFPQPTTWLYDGTAWNPLGSSPPILSGELDVLPNGDVIVTGALGAAHSGVIRWDGASWTPLGAPFEGGSSNIFSLTALASGEVIAGGAFDDVGGIVAGGVARWDTTAWTGPGAGMGRGIDATIVLANGDLVVAGSFESIGGVPAPGMARWDGTIWTAIHGGPAVVREFGEAANGDLYAAAQSGLYRYDGVGWTLLSANAALRAMVVLPNGDVVVGGPFPSISGVAATNVARWDGNSWHPMANGLLAPVNALAVMPNGDVAAAGVNPFSTLPNPVHRWNGSSWSTIGIGMNGAGQTDALAVMPNGDLVAGGDFLFADNRPAPGVARWNGSEWQALGIGVGGPVVSLLPLPNGDLVVGGALISAGGSPAERLARWDGSSWSLPGEVLGSSAIAFGTPTVRSMAFLPAGELVIGGAFGSVDGVLSANLARLVSSCPASATRVGSACAGSGGLNDFAALSDPWVGSTFRSEATGFAPTSLVAIDGGVATTGGIPLASIGLPAAVPGCLLHVAPIYFEVTTTTNGSVAWQWQVPSNAALAGFDVLFQMVAFAVDPQLNILETTSTNALQLTLGTF